MKKLVQLIMAAVLLSAAHVFAQDCKYDIKIKDKFSGKTRVGYWYQLGTDMITIAKQEEKITIEISSTFQGAMQKGIKAGETGQFRLANNEVITFTALSDAEPVIKANGTSTDLNSTIKAVFEISAEDLAKMAASAPVAMKVQMGSKDVVKEFGDKKSEKIRIAAKCISEFKE